MLKDKLIIGATLIASGMFLHIAIETVFNRHGSPGGEMLILPFILLLLYAGWTAGREYEAMRGGEGDAGENRENES